MELHPIIWNDEVCQIKVVLDSSVERTYSTENLVRKLKIKANNSHNVVLNTFGSQDGKSVDLKDYSFCVKNPKSGCNLYLTGFAVPVICVPSKECNFDIIEASFPAFRDLDFSDTRINGKEIDILIGMDYYWSVVNDGIKRSGTGGLVAVNSQLGWLLSEQVYNERETASTQSAIMKLATHNVY